MIALFVFVLYITVLYTGPSLITAPQVLKSLPSVKIVFFIIIIIIKKQLNPSTL